MTRKIVHQVIDDLDGSVIDDGAGETVHFSLDGTPYEIDLTADHADALRRAFEPYLAAARSISSGGGVAGVGGGRGGGRRRPGQQDYSAIRSWAKSNGFQVSERGRVPASVIEAYEAAN